MVATKIAVSKILSYSHPFPLKEAATPEQLLGFQTFLNWRGIITAEMLQHDPWIAALRDTALKNAVSEEVAAQAMSIKAWTKWIHEGPAAGLRRQHRFTRVADGWSPTARSSGIVGDVDGSDDIDLEDGLTTEQLEAIRQATSLGNAPAGAQQEAEDEARAWLKIWG